MDIGILLLFIVAGLVGLALWVHHSEKHQQAGQPSPAGARPNHFAGATIIKRGTVPGETAKTTDQYAQAVIAELRSALAVREETIKDLGDKGKRAVADRDRWEAAANELQSALAALKTEATGDEPDRFRKLKAALARMFHPDALSSASSFERVVREECSKRSTSKLTASRESDVNIKGCPSLAPKPRPPAP
jgi:hypothetical protein